jgi:2,5-diamino-6-(ribosylamino)-4(3H)-pyrimidinone 5'-phosphate reductase
MIPRIVLYNAVSVDGRITGFAADLETYYGEAMSWPTDAVLIGSETLLLSEEGFDLEDRRPSRKRKKKEGVLIVVPDSQGRVKNIQKLLDVPYWGEVIVLCSKSTPKDHLKYLEDRNVEYFVTGEDHVNIKASLEWLAEKHGVENLRADCGGTLNGVLLENGLADEVNILVHPCIAGGTKNVSIFKTANDMTRPLELELKRMEEKGNGLVLLSYEVKK